MCCKDCGKQIADDSKFCRYCGKSQISVTKVSDTTNQDGINSFDGYASVPSYMSQTTIKLHQRDTNYLKENCKAIMVCSGDGLVVGDNTKMCSQRGVQISAIDQDEFGTLHIEWKGAWTLFDGKVCLYVNGHLYGKYSCKDGFAVDIPIKSATTELRVKIGLNTARHAFVFEPNQNYTCRLTYSRFPGRFGFVVFDEMGHNVIYDSLSTLMGLLFFLFPIIGIIFAFSVKKAKPNIFFSTIDCGVLGFVMSIVYWMPIIIMANTSICLAIISTLGWGGLISIINLIKILFGIEIY